MYMSVFPACVAIHYVSVACSRGQRRASDPWTWSYKCVYIHINEYNPLSMYSVTYMYMIYHYLKWTISSNYLYNFYLCVSCVFCFIDLHAYHSNSTDKTIITESIAKTETHYYSSGFIRLFKIVSANLVFTFVLKRIILLESR